jgi:hypothetical protein
VYGSITPKYLLLGATASEMQFGLFFLGNTMGAEWRPAIFLPLLPLGNIGGCSQGHRA